MANFPSRCQHLKINGTQCGSPALRRNRFCFFHKRFQDERIRLSADRARRGVATFVLPVLEDANSIQIALMQVMRLLVAQQIDHKTASLLLYALQTASTNLRLTKFDPLRHDVVLDPRTVADTPLDASIWEDEDFEDEEDFQVEEAVEAVERAKRQSTMEHWAKDYVDRSFEALKRRHAAENADATEQPAAEVTATGSAVAASPSVEKKKPASHIDMDDVRQQVREQIRKGLFASGAPASSTPPK